jgi:hypothetical protein
MKATTYYGLTRRYKELTKKREYTGDKSHVALGVQACQVCLKEHTESVLLHKQLKQVLPPRMFTGWELCQEHKDLFDKGFIALVECKNAGVHLRLQQEDADRTGMIAHVKRTVWAKIFDTGAPEGPLVFVEEGLIAKLQGMSPDE